MNSLWHCNCLKERMVAYELYLYDKVEGYTLIGILPERRKDPKRITKESVLKWGRLLLSDSAGDKNIMFKQTVIDDITYHISRGNKPHLIE